MGEIITLANVVYVKDVERHLLGSSVTILSSKSRLVVYNTGFNYSRYDSLLS